MSTAIKSNTEASQRILLKVEAGRYTLDLSHLITSQQDSDIELSLSPPLNQKLVFQTANDYDVSLDYQSDVGIYTVSGDARDVAIFLTMVEMLPQGNMAHRPIIITSNVRDVSSDKDITYKILLAKDEFSGKIKTLFKQESAGQGVSQVAQIGSIFSSELDNVFLKDIDFSISDVNTSMLFEEASIAAKEKEIFGESAALSPPVIGNTAPTFTNTAVDVAEQNVLFNYMIAASDSNGDPLTIGSSTLPAWLLLTDNGDGTASLSLWHTVKRRQRF